MKTAEEWYKENNKSGECFALMTRSDIKQVQLDAWKQGMMDAIKTLDVTALQSIKGNGTDRDELLKAICRAVYVNLTNELNNKTSI